MRTNQRLSRAAARAGFSLAELMVVIVIIGLLGTVVVPNVMSRLTGGQVGTTKASISNIEQAATEFYGNNLRWPETLEELVTRDDKGTQYLNMDVVPTDAWNNEFVYEIVDGEPVIWSLGRDGAQGGEGPDRDFNNRMIRNKEI